MLDLHFSRVQGVYYRGLAFIQLLIVMPNTLGEGGNRRMLRNISFFFSIKKSQLYQDKVTVLKTGCRLARQVLGFQARVRICI